MGVCCSAYLEWEKEQERYEIQQKVNAQVLSEINNESVYVIGNNIHGGLTFNISNIHILMNFTQHNREYINDIQSGRYCTFYSDKHYNNIFSSGNNQNFTCVSEYPAIFNSSLDEITWFKDHALKIKKICVNHVSLCTFWITSNNQVYGNGINSNGVIGIGDDKIRIFPTLIPSLSKNMNVLDIISNQRYSVALCSTNKDVIVSIVNYWFMDGVINDDVIHLILKFYEINTVYSTAGFGDGEKWHNGKWNKMDTFKDKHIIKIGTGDKHSLILEDDGTVYCFGSNTFGELGIGDSTEYEEVESPTPIPYFIDNKIQIIDIKCGSEHNLLIDNNGMLYSFGLNAQRQCGIAGKSFIFKPQIIDPLKEHKITVIECGHRHSYCKSEDGLHFMFGSNEYNECITYDKRKKIAIPHCINNTIEEQCDGKYIKSVSLGYNNTKLIVRTANRQFAAKRLLVTNY